jgi:hypothetical protein
MIVDQVRLEEREGRARLSARLTGERRRRGPFELWYEFPAELSDGEADATPFLAATVVLCMRSRQRLHIDGRVSSELLAKTPELQEVYVRQCRVPEGGWTVRLSPIEVTAAEPRSLPPAASGRVAQFFTRGADSWYTLLGLDGTADAASHLVHATSLDVFLDPVQAERTRQLIGAAAARVGRTFVPVDTNLRELSDAFVNWDQIHPVGLMSVAHALAGGFSRFVLASTFTRGSLRPYGYDELAGLWSSERLRLRQHGADINRIDKFFAIAASPDAVETLKVCWEGNTALNCARCGKCLRSMAALYLVGALDRCPTFEHPFDPALISRSSFVTKGTRRNALEILDHAGDSDVDRALRGAIEDALGDRSPMRAFGQRAFALASQLDKLWLRGIVRRVYELAPDGLRRRRRGIL